MRPLIANLKPLCQRRDVLYLCWVFLPLGVIKLFLWFRVGFAPDVNELMLVLGLVIGILAFGFTAWTVPELIGKPFLHCLPGHHLAVRKAMFIAASTIAVLVTIAVLCSSDGWWWREPWPILAVFFLSVICCLAITDMVFIAYRRLASVLGLCPVVLLVLFGLLSWGASAGKWPMIEQTFVRYAFWIAAGEALVCLIHWVEFGRWACIRRVRASGRMWQGVSFVTGSHVGHAPQAATQDRAESRVLSGLTRFALRGMNGHPYLGYGRYVWGAVYTMAYPLARWGTWLAMALGAILLACGYFGRYPAWVSGVLFSWLPVPLAILPGRPVVFLPGGRQAILRAAIMTVTTLVGVVLLYLVGLIAISVVLSWVAPAIMIWGELTAYQSIPVQVLWAPILLIPSLCTLRMIFSPRALDILSLPAFLVLLQVCSMIMLDDAGRRIAERLAGAGGLILLIVSICAWTAFMVVARHVCIRRSFTGRQQWP